MGPKRSWVDVRLPWLDIGLHNEGLDRWTMRREADKEKEGEEERD